MDTKKLGTAVPWHLFFNGKTYWLPLPQRERILQCIFWRMWYSHYLRASRGSLNELSRTIISSSETNVHYLYRSSIVIHQQKVSKRLWRVGFFFLISFSFILFFSFLHHKRKYLEMVQDFRGQNFLKTGRLKQADRKDGKSGRKSGQKQEWRKVGWEHINEDNTTIHYFAKRLFQGSL